jgi:hypothetical protein
VYAKNHKLMIPYPNKKAAFSNIADEVNRGLA